MPKCEYKCHNYSRVFHRLARSTNSKPTAENLQTGAFAEKDLGTNIKILLGQADGCVLFKLLFLPVHGKQGRLARIKILKNLPQQKY